MKIGFIGLGSLGSAIAGRLASCGHELLVWNRTREKAEASGFPVADSPADLVSRSEVVCLCLFDSTAVRDVLSREDGICSVDLSGKVVVDFTTNHYKEVVAFYDLCRARGGEYLESPVLGSVVPASKGELTVVVSGNEDAFKRVEAPLLSCIGAHIFYLGEPGLASKMKVVNNLTLGVFMAAIAEALAVGEAAGISRQTVLDILSVGGGESLVLRAKKDRLVKEDFSTHFSNALIYKDLHCLEDLAYELKKSVPTAAAAKELFAQTFARGCAHEDFCAVWKVVR